MSCSGDGVQKLWDVDSKSEVRTITIESEIIFSPIFSPDGKRIAAYVNQGRSIGVWNVETGSLMGRHTKSTTIDPYQASLAFSPNGDELLSVQQDRDIELWDLSV